MYNISKLSKIISESKSLSSGFYKGVVVDNADLEGRLSRVKVSIPNLTEGIETRLLPWYSVKQVPHKTLNSHTIIPSLGSEVVVEFPTDDIFNGMVAYTVVSKPPV